MNVVRNVEELQRITGSSDLGRHLDMIRRFIQLFPNAGTDATVLTECDYSIAGRSYLVSILFQQLRWIVHPNLVGWWSLNGVTVAPSSTGSGLEVLCPPAEGFATVPFHARCAEVSIVSIAKCGQSRPITIWRDEERLFTTGIDAPV
ncbi:MAG: hypothetical protein HRU76_13380 [Phycisphaeraceae bacterium]|nr:hypothetical protein [Phycisphaerales bacterium]QOJ18517.1 MAG: hypothetical protein HRU76_13380 [Phycisphaeraceae bacterium]